MAKMESREEMLRKLRQKMSEKNKGRRDPDQFMPDKAKGDQKLEWFFRVLPPLEEGDTIKGGGVCGKSMDLWYYENGNHWINNENIECPRAHDGEQCPLCSMGFDLMKDNDDDEFKKRIRKQYMPRNGFATNVYFLNHPKNPENLRGKVMWFNLPITVWKLMNAVIENDDPGTVEDPRATGLFYHPTEDGYTFKLVATHQGGFNNYEQSMFLANSKGPLVKAQDGSPDMEKIQKILDQRIYVVKKFADRNVTKLEKVVEKLLAHQAGNSDEEQAVEEEEIKLDGIQKGGAKNIAPKQVTDEVLEEEVEQPKPAVKQAPKPSPVAQVAPKPAAKPQASQPAQPKPQAQAPAKKVAPPSDDAELDDILSKINSDE